MFESRMERAMWLLLPKVAQYRYGGGATETAQQQVIVNVADIELIQSADSAHIDGKYVACCTVHLRSGHELVIALSVDRLWELLT